MMRLGTVGFLGESPDCEVVGEAETFQQALDLTLKLRPDVVLTDIRLKGDQTGIDLARELRQRVPEIKIIVHTNFPHEPYVRAMMELGVEGYLLKDTPPADVLEAVRMVMRGRNVYSSTISSGIVRGYLDSPYNRSRGSKQALTSREAEVLQLIADGRTNDDISEALGLSIKSVQVHLTNLYSKLGVHSRTEAIIQAARRGLIVMEGPT